MDESRYRHAERLLWTDAGASPTEHRLHLDRNDVDVRVQEVGQGPPVLFVHGGPGASGAQWAHLAAQLPGLRCLLLDRPGTGLSAASPLADATAVRHECETLVPDVLDAMGIERAHLVGSSHGGYVALLAGALHPERVDRIALLGCPGFVEGMRLTTPDRLALLPGARHLFALSRPSEKALRKILRQLGHGTSLDVGRVPQALIEWYVALQRDTDTMGNEFAAISAMGTFRSGFDPLLSLVPGVLAAVQAPTYFLWGTEEVYGDESVARRAAAAMPDAQVEMLEGAGHLCWIDDIDHAATVVLRHLLGATVTAPETAEG
jgi:2-hydroxy-6-oxonona-2,4-dienedioate hydrolase